MHDVLMCSHIVTHLQAQWHIWCMYASIGLVGSTKLCSWSHASLQVSLLVAEREIPISFISNQQYFMIAILYVAQSCVATLSRVNAGLEGAPILEFPIPVVQDRGRSNHQNWPSPEARKKLQQ